MKILMFGWEFPPHISGGLGTACFGLTQALAKEGVQQIFVVPRLTGDENEQNLKLVSAGEVEIPFPPGEAPPPVKVITRSETVLFREKPAKIYPKKKKEVVTRVFVESGLTPYTSPSHSTNTWTVESWNYVIEKQEPERIVNTIVGEEERAVPGYHYAFKGGYGTSLMEEVAQYALAGRAISIRYSFDVIHAHDWMTFPAGVAAKAATGKPLVIHVHATEFDRSGACAGPVFDIEKSGMASADRIIAVSNWTKDILVNNYGIESDKISVVHNGIFSSGERHREVSAMGSQVVTFVGRVTHQKGPCFFIEACRKVLEKFPDAHFIVAGSGDLLPQTIERVAQLRMSHKFHFTGFLTREWIDRIWSISQVYVMPSVSEPFGITPLEAIQAGVPVIISNQSGVAEVMPHALKVDFWDTDGLAEAICSMLNYKSLSVMLRQKGEHEIKELSWDKTAQKIKHLYEEIVVQR